MIYNTLCKIWIPVTVVHVMPKDSYQVCTSNDVIYCHRRQHFCECNVKPTETISDVTTAIPQDPARPHISVPLCACQACATAAASTHCTRNACDSKTTNTSCPRSCPCAYVCNTRHSPVQPWRSGHACITPNHLIQEL